MKLAKLNSRTIIAVHIAFKIHLLNNVYPYEARLPMCRDIR
jgi:hypothetical protein